jgi:chromosome segregation ATPase
MSKFGGFLARKTSVPATPPLLATEPAESKATAATSPLEIDEELFSSLGAQVGGENEALRNLLVDANAKIGELDTIKDAVNKLVDPVSKALRAFEAEKSEKLAIQTVLNNTRTAYGKLRNEVADLEKKAASAESDCRQLRQELATTQNQVRTLEATKAEVAVEIAARRAQIADLETRLAQECAETKTLREENRRFDERLSAATKRITQLESDLNAARQRLLLAEDEKRALQSSLDRSIADASKLSRKLSETEAALTASQGRLRHVEGNFAELSNERTRLARALEEATERYEQELTSQRMRVEALTSRASASDKLLGEAREHLLGKAEEIRDYDRRLSEQTMARELLEAKLAEAEAERITRDSRITELDSQRTTLSERAGALTRAYTAKEAALARAEETIQSLNERVTTLQNELENAKHSAEQRIEELNAALRREKMERSVVEGALETGRKDFARLMREVLALQRAQQERETVSPRAANAA